MRHAECLVANPSTVDGRGPDFSQRHPQDLKQVCHRLCGSCFTYDVAPSFPLGQQRPKRGIDLNSGSRHFDIVPAQDERSLDDVPRHLPSNE